MEKGLRGILSGLDRLERESRAESPLRRLDPRAGAAAAAVCLTAMLSVPPEALSDLSLFFLFPFLAAQYGRLSYGRLFRRSLVALPFAAAVGIFGLFCDRTPLFRIGMLTVTRGGAVFVSLLLRALLSAQILLVLIASTGVHRLCRALRRLGLPAIFAAQLLLVCRYLRVLAGEALDMTMARDARGFGRGSYPLRMWAALVGPLLIRTFDRAERIGRAMSARGFEDRFPDYDPECAGLRWRRADTLFLLAACAAAAAIRLLHPAGMLAACLGPF